MDISDEMLNAFIDGELPPLEMNIVRDAIAKSERVAERVEALTMLNSQVYASLHAIDDKPMSPGLEKLRQTLADAPKDAHRENILSFPWWRSVKSRGVWQSAIAASVAAVFGFYIGLGPQSMSGVDALPEWTLINQALSNQPSGQMITTAKGSTVEVRLSFVNTQDEYCRQFYLKPKGGQALQSIACRMDDNWILRAAMPSGDAGSYQTASHDPALDRVIDNMIQGEFLSPDEEQRLIEDRWQP